MGRKVLESLAPETDQKEVWAEEKDKELYFPTYQERWRCLGAVPPGPGRSLTRTARP